MSCRRHRKEISDRLDGALSARRAWKLERHLASCPDCRAYDQGLRCLQDAAGRAPGGAFTPEYGRDFLERLRKRLEQEQIRPVPAGVPLWRKPWAWGTAGMAAAGAALLAGMLLLRPVPRAEVYLLSETDTFSRIYGQYTQSPELERGFNDLLLSSIDDSLKAGEETLPADPFDNPMLAEGVSDEDLKALSEGQLTDAPR